MKLRDIRKYWETQGRNFPIKGKITPTSRDPYLGRMERSNVMDYLSKANRLLEIGCGDGSHSVHYAECVRKFYGVDVSEGLIDVAKRRFSSEKVNNAEFAVGSALDIKAMCKRKRFDRIISQRCLINLPEWKFQKEAILQIRSVLAHDGIFLLTEGFQDGVDNLNDVRRKHKLSPIKVVPYNRNIRRAVFEKFITRYFDIESFNDYGAYLFFSRVFHPLIVWPKEPKHDSKFNKVAMDIADKVRISGMEKYSYNLFYALRKK